ncbi:MULTISPECIES: hypothetical protein [Mycobacterium]|uniref:hypothetical protein n=1 Tax=Mycobacterium TaxID=1763 RepID=UPI00096A94F4|nr:MULTISPECIES: hypothetical protein [Mycobacterium]MCG7607012.1 hypothetical protein [Mycobacterium sp. CnD-18-1]
MNFKRLTCASALSIALGTGALAAGAGTAAAQPGPPCGFGNCQGPGGPGPGGPGGPGRPGGSGGAGGPERGHGGPGGGPDGPGWPGGPGGPGGPGPGRPGDRGPGGPDDHGRHWGPPPPELAWRGMDQGRFDHQPFNYNGSWVTPIFDPGYNAWGFWFFGIWIPL